MKEHGKSKGKSHAMPGCEHWEKTYDETAPSANMRHTEGADFNPKRSKDRKTTHVKVNETDN